MSHQQQQNYPSYFARLPTKRNRQDLAFALDRLPSILTDYLHHRRNSTNSNNNGFPMPFLGGAAYPSPPPSPIHSAVATGGNRARSMSFSSVTSLSSTCSSITSTTSSTTSSSSNTHESRQRRRQHKLIARNLSLYTHQLQFRNRAQAMAFLIQLLKTMQTPEACVDPDVEYDEAVEHYHLQQQGMAPCYVCGEWYPEQVALYDQYNRLVQVVDGKQWHEQGQGGSLRHPVAERQVRKWLEQVVVVCAVYVQEEEEEIKEMEAPPPARPSSYMIPQEILDPSCRSPGFRIKDKKPSRQVEDTTPSASPRSSFQFTFTSERFRTAVQEAAQEQLPQQQQKQTMTMTKQESGAQQEAEGDTEEFHKTEQQQQLAQESPESTTSPSTSIVTDEPSIISESEPTGISSPSVLPVYSTTKPVPTSSGLLSVSSKPTSSHQKKHTWRPAGVVGGSWSIARKTWRLVHRILSVSRSQRSSFKPEESPHPLYI